MARRLILAGAGLSACTCALLAYTKETNTDTKTTMKMTTPVTESKRYEDYSYFVRKVSKTPEPQKPSVFVLRVDGTIYGYTADGQLIGVMTVDDFYEDAVMYDEESGMWGRLTQKTNGGSDHI